MGAVASQRGRYVLRVRSLVLFEVEVLAGSTRQALELAHAADLGDLRTAAHGRLEVLDPAVEAVALVEAATRVEHRRVLDPGEDFRPFT